MVSRSGTSGSSQSAGTTSAGRRDKKTVPICRKRLRVGRDEQQQEFARAFRGLTPSLDACNFGPVVAGARFKQKRAGERKDICFYPRQSAARGQDTAHRAAQGSVGPLRAQKKNRWGLDSVDFRDSPASRSSIRDRVAGHHARRRSRSLCGGACAGRVSIPAISDRLRHRCVFAEAHGRQRRGYRDDVGDPRLRPSARASRDRQPASRRAMTARPPAARNKTI